jgi:hypothetical protein
MASSVTDFKVAGVAAGFTLGFGFLTVWKAIKQTRNVKAPHRSTYLYLVWGEILSNLSIGIIGWLFLEGVIPLGVPVLFSLLFCWVFEIQLLMQIIINRIFVVAESKEFVTRMKWTTAGIITAINIAVFCIWIPAHLDPPPNEIYVQINKYWDRTSKALICIVDAVLNYWFLRIVKQRLVRYHGLKKYARLVSFNARLMVLSVSMDIMLIGLMSLQNQLVYIQFHPVTYMVKLNIEMTMAALIAKIARGPDNEIIAVGTSSHHSTHRLNTRGAGRGAGGGDGDNLRMGDMERHGQDSETAINHKYMGSGTICKETTIQVVTSNGDGNGTKNGKFGRASQRLSRTLSELALEDDQLPLKRQDQQSQW